LFDLLWTKGALPMSITFEADLAAIEARIAALPEWEGKEVMPQRTATPGKANAKSGAQNLELIRELLNPPGGKHLTGSCYDPMLVLVGHAVSAWRTGKCTEVEALKWCGRANNRLLENKDAPEEFEKRWRSFCRRDRMTPTEDVASYCDYDDQVPLEPFDYPPPPPAHEVFTDVPDQEEEKLRNEIDPVAEAIKIAGFDDPRPLVSAINDMRHRTKAEWCGEAMRKLSMTSEGLLRRDDLKKAMAKAVAPNSRSVNDVLNMLEKAARTYDDEIKAHTRRMQSAASVSKYADPKPAANRMTLADILDVIYDRLDANVTCGGDLKVTLALMAVASWGIQPGYDENDDKTQPPGPEWMPAVLITGVGSGIGKTRAIDTIAPFLRRFKRAQKMSPSQLFRTAHQDQPTFFFDDVHKWLLNNPQYETHLLGMSSRVSTVDLSEGSEDGKSFKQATFFQHAAMFAAGVGGLGKRKDEQETRSLVFTMMRDRSRARQHVPIARLRQESRQLRQQYAPHLQAWRDDICQAFANTEEATWKHPLIIGRDRENWAIPHMVAYLAGREWEKRIDTVLDAVAASRHDDPLSSQEELLVLLQDFVQARDLNYNMAEGAFAEDNPMVTILSDGGQRFGTYTTCGAEYDPRVPREFVPTENFREWMRHTRVASRWATPRGGRGEPASAAAIADGLRWLGIRPVQESFWPNGERHQVRGYWRKDLEIGFTHIAKTERQ
jgi:hypothetical protein